MKIRSLMLTAVLFLITSSAYSQTTGQTVVNVTSCAQLSTLTPVANTVYEITVPLSCSGNITLNILPYSLMMGPSGSLTSTGTISLNTLGENLGGGVTNLNGGTVTITNTGGLTGSGTLTINNSGPGGVVTTGGTLVGGGAINPLGSVTFATGSLVSFITNCSDLQNINNNLSGNYQLTNDIDCTDTKNWVSPQGSGFLSLGNFTGSLSGLSADGHTAYRIKNLVIYGNTQYEGNTYLFTSLQGAQIHDLIFNNLYISGSTGAAFIGTIYAPGSMSRVSIDGNMRTYLANSQIAVVINNQGLMSQVSAHLDMQANAFTGASGLVLYNYGTIQQAAVHSTLEVGAAPALAVENHGTITDSYADGAITGQSGYGLVFSNFGNIANSYSAVQINETDNPANSAGLVMYNSGTVTNSFWDTQASSIATSAGGVGETTSWMQTQSNYPSSWDFANTWIVEPQHYPSLVWGEQSQIDLWNTFSAASQESTFEPASPPGVVNWTIIDGINSLAINWVDLYILSRPPVWNYSSATPVSGFINSVNWTYLGALSDSPINWIDVTVLSRLGIDWASVNPLVKSGINWSDWLVSTTSAVNWLSISTLSNVGINWNGIGTLNDKVDWANLAAMTHQNINWSMLDLLSRVNVNWDNPSVLNEIPITPTNLHTLRTIGVQTVLPSYVVTINAYGGGSGAISCNGVACPASESVPSGTSITFKATPNTGSVFAGWGGACTTPIGNNSNGTCTLNNITSATTVIAIFNVPPPMYAINLFYSGTGGGTILCNGSPCQGTVPAQTTITFTAQPNSNSVFAGWGDVCAASGGTSTGPCTVSNINAPINVLGIFNLIPPVMYTVTTSTSGPGNGQLLCNGIACHTSESVASGTVISFTGQPDKRSILEGLGGVCAAPGGPIFTCKFDVTFNISVSAYFIKSPPPAPTDLKAVSGATGISLSWSNQYGVPFNLYRAQRGVNGDQFTLIKSVEYPNTSYTDNTMPNDGRYRYYVTGVYYPSIESPKSKTVAVTWKDLNLPTTPTGLTASTSSGKVDLSWNSSSGADEYIVKRALANANGTAGAYTIIASITADPTDKTTSSIDRSVVNGKTYFYTVAAQNDKGTSVYTAPLSIKAK